MKSRFTDAMKKKIAEERRSGEPMKSLCAKYHICAKTIRTWINKISETDDRDLINSVRRRQKKTVFLKIFANRNSHFSFLHHMSEANASYLE